jgi:hypothetical protein
MNRFKKRTPAELCERIKELGYSVGRRIQLYGQRMELVSDPFVKDGLIAVRVRTSGGGSERVLYLPSTVLQVIR